MKSVPAKLHARLKRAAAAHRRLLTQETMHLLEKALAAEEAAPAAPNWTLPIRAAPTVRWPNASKPDKRLSDHFGVEVDFKLR